MPKQSTGPGRTSSTRKSNTTRPLGPRAQRIPSQAKSPARIKLEQRSIRPLHFFRKLPKFVLPVVMGVFLFLGLFSPTPLAGAFLLVLGGFLGWLLALSWPALNVGSRWIRVIVVIAILAAAIWRFAGYGSA